MTVMQVLSSRAPCEEVFSDFGFGSGSDFLSLCNTGRKKNEVVFCCTFSTSHTLIKNRKKKGLSV